MLLPAVKFYPGTACVSFVFSPMLPLAVALTLWWPCIQGSPPLFFCVVFWSTACCFYYRHLTNGRLDCKSRWVWVLHWWRINNRKRKNKQFTKNIYFWINVVSWICVFQCQPTALLRATDSTQGGWMALSVVYFRITYRLGRPHYVWNEYLYSVREKVEVRMTVCITVCVV